MSQLKHSPSSNNILAGADVVLVTFPGDSFPTHFGHIDPLGVNPELQNKELTGVSGGVIGVVKRRQVHLKTTYSLKAYERTEKILRAWFFGGSAASATQTAGTDGDEAIADITGAAAYGDVLAGVWYPLAKRGVSSVVIGDGGTPATNLVENTDYQVDYHAGRICFLRALAGAGEYAYSVTYSYEAQTQRTFSKHAVSEQIVSAEVWRYFEDGKVIEKETLPKCYLEPAGNAKDEPQDNTGLEFNLIQVPHATLAWGTINRVDRG
jgi:hypothetical protein